MSADVITITTPIPPQPEPEPARKRTITLTNRAPVQIVESEWPVVAQGYCGDEDEGAPFGWSVKFFVRRNAETHTTIIYGGFSYFDEDKHRHQRVRVGRLLTMHEAAESLHKHMLDVGEELRDRILFEKFKVQVTLALDDCFADLPPHPPHP